MHVCECTKAHVQMWEAFTELRKQIYFTKMVGSAGTRAHAIWPWHPVCDGCIWLTHSDLIFQYLFVLYLHPWLWPKKVKYKKEERNKTKHKYCTLKAGNIRLVSCLCNIILTALSTLAGDLKWGSSSRARFQPSPVSYIQYHEALSAVTDARDSLSSLPATPHPVRSHQGPSHQRRRHRSQMHATGANLKQMGFRGRSRGPCASAIARRSCAHTPHRTVQHMHWTHFDKCHADKHSSQVHLSFVLCEVWVDCVSVFFFSSVSVALFLMVFSKSSFIKKENKI